MSQNGMKQYAERLLNGSHALNATGEQPAVASDVNEQQRALRVLTLAQKTADEHIVTARYEADTIRNEAREAAAQIVAQAQAQAKSLRDEAEQVLAQARVTAAKVTRDAQALATDAERKADDVVSDARARAHEIVGDAQAHADEVRQRAQQIYEDVVGGLSAKREALQDQIEALEQFDRDYRARLASFMQQQLRSLWVDEPPAPDEVEEAVPVAAELLPAQRKVIEQTADSRS